MEKIIYAVITALIGVLIWYLKAQTNRQNKREDKRDVRDTKREDKIMEIVDTSLKHIELTSTENKALNKQIAVIQERTFKAIHEHKKESREALTKLCETLDNLLKTSNGGNPEVVKLRKEIEIIKKKLDKK